jgi:hypothetical protein
MKTNLRAVQIDELDLYLLQVKTCLGWSEMLDLMGHPVYMDYADTVHHNISIFEE